MNPTPQTAYNITLGILITSTVVAGGLLYQARSPLASSGSASVSKPAPSTSTAKANLAKAQTLTGPTKLVGRCISVGPLNEIERRALVVWNQRMNAAPIKIDQGPTFDILWDLGPVEATAQALFKEQKDEARHGVFFDPRFTLSHNEDGFFVAAFRVQGSENDAREAAKSLQVSMEPLHMPGLWRARPMTGGTPTSASSGEYSHLGTIMRFDSAKVVAAWHQEMARIPDIPQLAGVSVEVAPPESGKALCEGAAENAHPAATP